MKHKFLAGLVCFSFLLVSALGVFAQTATSGQVIGTVKDPTGAVVPGAKVTLTSATGEKRDATADGQGDFRFPLVAPGTYTLTVDAQGFKSMTADGVVVKVTETTELTANLRLAGTTESVEITAEPPLVQTSSPTAGRVIAETQIKQLPLPTRNFQQLLALSPGTVANLANNTELGRGDVNISVSGQRTTSNNVLVDGTEVNSAGTNGTGNISVPSPDSVQEFIVQTSLYDATTGRNAGGNIAVVTKSGTNNYHGSVFEFLRNDALNANDYFLNQKGRARPVLKRNQFGGTFGGPIVRDKTFFFVSYQGTRERNGASLSNSLMTPNIPAGLTNDRSDAALQTLATSFGAATLSPISKALLQAKLPNGQYAIPSAGGTAASATTSVATPLSEVSRFREDQFSVNIDQQIAQANHLSGKFFFSNTPQYQANFSFVGGNLFQTPGYGGNIDFHNRVFTLSDTHVFSPTVINEARFGFSRIHGPSTPEEPFKGSDFGITNPLCTTNPSFCGMPTIGVTGLFTIGSTYLADQESNVETFQYSDMVSWTHGKHFVRFGGEARHYDVNFFFNFFSRGQISFSNFTSFLQGSTTNATLAPVVAILGDGVRSRHYRSTDFSWFVQDDFRASNSMTLNLGLRFGRNGGISDRDGVLSNFDPAEFAAIGHACTTLTPCTSNNGFNMLKAGETLNPDDWTVAPRFGFAWKPTAKGNFVARGGVGVYFDRFSMRLANLQIFNYPSDIVSYNVNPPFATPFPNLGAYTYPVATTVPSPVTYTAFNIPLPISGIYVDKNFRTPYVYQYNLGVQWEVAKNWLVDVGYVGSTGRKLINVMSMNQGTAGTYPYNTASGLFGYALSPAISANKLLTSGFQLAQSNANSNYNSLQTSLTKRFSNGLQFLASYTWSKSMDYNSGQILGNELQAPPGDQQNMVSQYAVSDFDRPHRFVFSGLYDFPKFYHGDSGFAKRVLNGWETTSIMTFQSGTPFSVICNSGNALYNRADLVPGQQIEVDGSTESKLNNYFNTAAFATLCTNTAPYGTSPRNLIRGPHQSSIDLGIVKFIPINERQKMEFRAEFFNAFNFANFGLPANNTLVPSTLGKITTTSTGPRVIQFALKYSF